MACYPSNATRNRMCAPATRRLALHISLSLARYEQKTIAYDCDEWWSEQHEHNACCNQIELTQLYIFRAGESILRSAAAGPRPVSSCTAHACASSGRCLFYFHFCRNIPFPIATCTFGRRRHDSVASRAWKCVASLKKISSYARILASEQCAARLPMTVCQCLRCRRLTTCITSTVPNFYRFCIDFETSRSTFSSKWCLTSTFMLSVDRCRSLPTAERGAH